jgi:chemotaxis protein MotB|tara:strand:+ start:489 stop:1268 length:780 start_codon:yes stop_codon:yes gene_type:complete
MASPAEKKSYKKGFKAGADSVEEGLPGWFGTFADMMTLLFAFFVLLAAISTIDPVKLQQMADSMGKKVGTKSKEGKAMNLADIKKAAEKIEKDMPGDVEVKTSPKGVTIGISSDISFAQGKADLSAQVRPILQKLVPLINKSYNMVAVEGHTDNQAPNREIAKRYPTNWELSGARAAAVVRELGSLSVDPTRLQAVGYAEFVPRDITPKEKNEWMNSDNPDKYFEELIKKKNKTKSLRARNRRVEITFLATSLDRPKDL